eukprot:6212625-Pleurochrysis_carterae.AAC.1
MQRNPAESVVHNKADGLQDSADDIPEVLQAVRLCRCTGASRPLALRGAFSIGRLRSDALVRAQTRRIRNGSRRARDLVRTLP